MSPDLDELVMKQNNAAAREDPDCVDHHRCLPKHLNLIPESEPIICLDLTDPIRKMSLFWHPFDSSQKNRQDRQKSAYIVLLPRKKCNDDLLKILMFSFLSPDNYRDSHRYLNTVRDTRVG